MNDINDIIYDQFQDKVKDTLIRHNSILDIITKLQETDARVNRAAIKTITSCGCIHIEARDPEIPEESNYEDLRHFKHTESTGELCDTCKEKIEEEMGKHMFYLAALCNHYDLNLYDIMLKEYKRLEMLGKFNMF